MFLVRKNARIHESKASEKYSKAEIERMTKERSPSRYYGFPFGCPVIGMLEPEDGDGITWASDGDEFVPSDMSKRIRFDDDPDYATEKLQSDVQELVGVLGFRETVAAINNGVDLHCRRVARPSGTKGRKLSDNDKFALVLGDADHATAVGWTPGGDVSFNDVVRYFNHNMAE